MVTGYKSIYGGSFEADNFSVKHDKPGILTMVASKPGELIMGSTFQIFRYASSWHNNHHAAFGEVLTGMDVVEQIGRLHPADGPPSRPVVITDCGIIAVNLLLKDPQTKSISEMITEMMNNPSKYKSLLELRGKRAEIVLDVMQKALDSQSIPENLRRSTIKAMMRLCKASGNYPPCLELRGIKLEDNPKTSGAFGDVWKGTFRGKLVCVKVSRVYQGSNIQHLISNFVGEAIVWRQCMHPNLLPFYGISRLKGSHDRVCLVSPWMENGNISEFLKSNQDAPRLPLVYDVLDGLAYLHHHSIVHGDLKGANILVTPAGSACLADFGLSSIQDPEILRWTSLSTASPSGGTTRWEAPELFDDDLESSRPTFKSDVYSIACVMYEVLTGLVPFYEFPRDTTVMFKIMSGVRPSRPSPTPNSELLDEVWSIMQECWVTDPQGRPEINKVIDQVRKIYPGPLILMRWMMWIRKWQQQQVDVLHGLGPHGADMRNLCLSGVEMDTLKGFSGYSRDGIAAGEEDEDV